MERYNDDPQPQFYAPSLPPTKKRSAWPWFALALIIAGMAACCGIFVFDRGDKGVTVVPSGDTGAPVLVPTPGKISEGTWIVGKDVKPGKYKTLGAVDSVLPLCYWDVRTGSEAGDIVVQGLKDKVGAQGLVTLKKGQYFTTSGCSNWTLDDGALNLSWGTTPAKATTGKTYVIETLPSSWPVTSAQAFVDKYTGSNWVMTSKCPTGAHRCIFVKSANLSAPVIAATYCYNCSRVTIKVDLDYAASRGVNTQTKRKYVLAHEFGHAGWLKSHSSAKNNLMYASVGHWGFSLTKSQKTTLAKH